MTCYSMRRALAAFTDAKSGLVMPEISRVKVLVYNEQTSEWDDPVGSLFHSGMGVYEYFAEPHESIVRFIADGTNEGEVWKVPKTREEEVSDAIVRQDPLVFKKEFVGA